MLPSSLGFNLQCRYIILWGKSCSALKFGTKLKNPQGLISWWTLSGLILKRDQFVTSLSSSSQLTCYAVLSFLRDKDTTQRMFTILSVGGHNTGFNLRFYISLADQKVKKLIRNLYKCKCLSFSSFLFSIKYFTSLFHPGHSLYGNFVVEL